MAAYCGVATGAVETGCFADTRKAGGRQVKRGKGVFACPAMSDLAAANRETDGNIKSFMSDYGLTQHVSNRSLAAVAQPGRTFAFMDMSSAGRTISGSCYLTGWMPWGCDSCAGQAKVRDDGGVWPMYDWTSPRHGDKLAIDIAYADGHAAGHFMPLRAGTYFIEGSGDVPQKCNIGNKFYKAGVWWHKYPHD